MNPVVFIAWGLIYIYRSISEAAHNSLYLRRKFSSGFPYFLQFKSEFDNKELMIWATVSSWSCFCWLYTVSPSLAAKNIINLISVLTIWWCPCITAPQNNWVFHLLKRLQILACGKKDKTMDFKMQEKKKKSSSWFLKDFFSDALCYFVCKKECVWILYEV